MRRLLKYRLLLIITALVILADQASKLWIERCSGLELGVYPPFDGFVIIPDFLSIVYNVNAGAAWGMFSGFGKLLALFGLLALCAIYFMRRHLELHKLPMQLVFGLSVGGIIGNLLDRVRIGHVIDFIDVNLGFYRWPTFNIADSAMVVGVSIYVVIGIIADIKERKAARRSSDNS